MSLNEYAPFLISNGFLLIPIGIILIVGYLTIKLFHILESDDNYKPVKSKKKSRDAGADDGDESSDPMDGRDDPDDGDTSHHDLGYHTEQVELRDFTRLFE